MDTIYSQRTGANPVSFSQNYNNPMINAPRQGANTGNIQDYLRGYNGIPQNILDMTSPMSQPQPQQPVEQPQQAPNQLTPDGLQRLQGLIGSAQGNVQAMQGQQPLQSNGGLSGVDIGDPSQPNEDGMMQGLDMSNPLPISAPKEISQNPTDDVKTYSPENVQAGINGLNIGMQSRTSNSPMASQSQQIDQGRMNQDLTAIAQAKDPKKAWQEIKKDPFYKDSNFYTGMMNVGLAIMSGANPMQAFQAGSQAMTQADMKDQLRGNRDALLESYTPDSVANAISQGNPQLLQMRQMSDEDKLQAQENMWDRKSNIQREDEQRQAERDQRWKQENQDRSFSQQARMNDLISQRQLGLVNARQDVKDANAQKAAGSLDFTSKDLNAEKNTSDGKVVTAWGVKHGYFQAADKDLDLALDAIKRGDSQAATAAFKQAVFNSARGEIGENRSLQGSDLGDFAEDPNVLVRSVNDIRLKSGFTPTLAAINYIKKANQVGSQSAQANFDRVKNEKIKANAKTMDPKRATALVNRAFGNGWHDPLGVFDKDTDEKAQRSGALSGSSSDIDSLIYNN